MSIPLQRASDLALEDPLESEGQQDKVGGRIFVLDERDPCISAWRDGGIRGIMSQGFTHIIDDGFALRPSA